MEIQTQKKNRKISLFKIYPLSNADLNLIMKRNRNQAKHNITLHDIMQISDLCEIILSFVASYCILTIKRVDKAFHSTILLYMRKRFSHSTKQPRENDMIISLRAHIKFTFFYKKNIIPQIIKENNIELLQLIIPKTGIIFPKHLNKIIKYGNDEVIKWVLLNCKFNNKHNFTQSYIHAAKKGKLEIIQIMATLKINGPGPLIFFKHVDGYIPCDRAEIEFCLYLTKKSNKMVDKSIDWLIKNKFRIFFITSSLYFNRGTEECDNILINYYDLNIENYVDANTYHETLHADEWEYFREHVKNIEIQ